MCIRDSGNVAAILSTAAVEGVMRFSGTGVGVGSGVGSGFGLDVYKRQGHQ